MNNYDCSSTGVNIEFFHSFNCDEARLLFEDNFSSLYQARRWGENSVYLYTPGGEIKAPDDWQDLVYIPHTKTNNQKAIEIAREDYYGYDEKVLVRDAWDYIEGNMLEDYFRTWWDEDGDFWQLVEKFNYKVKRDFEVYGSRGYSQGDYVEIVLFWDDLARVWGKKDLEKSKIKREIDQLCWDCPYWGRLEINGEEYYIHERVEDVYAVDEDEVKAILLNIAREKGKRVLAAMKEFVEGRDFTPQVD